MATRTATAAPSPRERSWHIDVAQARDDVEWPYDTILVVKSEGKMLVFEVYRTLEELHKLKRVDSLEILKWTRSISH